MSTLKDNLGENFWGFATLVMLILTIIVVPRILVELFGLLDLELNVWVMLVVMILSAVVLGNIVWLLFCKVFNLSLDRENLLLKKLSRRLRLTYDGATMFGTVEGRRININVKVTYFKDTPVYVSDKLQGKPFVPIGKNVIISEVFFGDNKNIPTTHIVLGKVIGDITDYEKVSINNPYITENLTVISEGGQKAVRLFDGNVQKILKRLLESNRVYWIGLYSDKVLCEIETYGLDNARIISKIIDVQTELARVIERANR